MTDPTGPDPVVLVATEAAWAGRRLGPLRDLAALRGVLASATNVLVLTGAGISAASGIAPYRGPAAAGTAPGPTYFTDGRDPGTAAGRAPDPVADLWRSWGPRRAAVAAARPSVAHLALASYLASTPEQLVGPPPRDLRGGDGGRVLVTQNVDDLHERAQQALDPASLSSTDAPVGASTPVAHLHGRLLVSRCTRDGSCYRAPDTTPHSTAPPCPRCGAPLRPDVVAFGEPVDIDAQWTAKRAVRSCELFLAVGTSGVVAPANGLLRYARDVGALTVTVNPDEVGLDGGPLHGTSSGRFDVHVRANAETALPLLLGRS